MLLVLVLDENDNAPVWTFPPANGDLDSSKRHINVTTGFRPGTLVARLQAYDLDADEAGRVEYQVLDPRNNPIPPVSIARGLYNAQVGTAFSVCQNVCPIDTLYYNGNSSFTPKRMLFWISVLSL